MGFAERLGELLAAQGISGRELARRIPCDRSYVSMLLSGRRRPAPEMAARIDEVLGAGGQLAALAASGRAAAAADAAALDDEIVALELARRASASDVGAAAVERIEQAADALAVAYPGTPPGVLLSRVRRHLGYVTSLADARATLAERRRLLAAAGWLSLLAATCMIDLGRRDGAAAHLATAAQLAAETGHAELAAWCLETRAWQVLTDGDYAQAAEISRAAQRVAPAGGSAVIQATAQEGRAMARLGASRETYGALCRVEALVSPLAPPSEPEHHYRYDPAKAEAYVATTLSWIGDKAAVGCTRQVLARLESGAAGGPPRPRRAASARLDLALALAGAGQPAEAAGTALDAVTSGLLVPSNWWRAEEVITAVATRAEPEARELREAYAGMRRAGQAAAPRELC
jgi:transcriptional regulator with XRE-family HTH domain